MQVPAKPGAANDEPDRRYAEDCLYLNVWRPRDAGAGKLPVLVWIYGGSFTRGGASQRVFDGARLASRGVIVVTFNYRLGTLGYLADRYGFEVIGTVLGGTSSLAETNPAALEELAQLIIAAGLPAIFTEAETSARDIEALASRVGNLQVISLLTESLDAPGTSGDSYIGLLRSTAEAILSGLGN
jgi:para-nitrobenzyl esterase